MNYKFRTDPLIKPFNQSIGRLSLTKTKSLLFASLLVGAWSRYFQRLCRPLGLHRYDRGRTTRRHFPHPAFRALINKWHRAMAPTWD